MKKIITFLLLFLYLNLAHAQSTITLTPQLSSTAIPIKDFFGLNGQNTNDPGLGFDNPSVINALDLTQTSTLRLPGGTVANYWDWKQGNYITPISPATNCFGLPDDFGATNPQNNNSLSSFKNAIRRSNAKPIWTLNLLTDDLASQLSMLSEAKLLGLPVEYIELGNEFYLLNDCYEEKFPSPSSYGELVAEWIPEIRNRFPGVRIACVGATSETSSPDRRSTWNSKLRGYFSTININSRPDAFTIHDYKTSSLGSNCTPTDFNSIKCNSNTYSSLLFGSVYKNYESIKQNDYIDINPIPATDYKYWFTEYNLLDRSFNIHGSWAHALHTAEMTLLYLKDADKVELINCHTLIGNGIFSSIFNSTDGYNYSQNVANSFCQPSTSSLQPLTNDFTLSGLGVVMNQLGLVLKDATSIREITFGTATPTVTTTITNCSNTTTNPGLISYRSEDQAGNIQVLFLNLTNNNIDIQNCVNNIFPSGTTLTNVNYQSFGFNPNDYFAGYLPSSSSVSVFNNLTNSTSNINVSVHNMSSQTLSISPYSITRVWVYANNIAIKANANLFCEGQEFMLTAHANPNLTNFQWYLNGNAIPGTVNAKTYFATAGSGGTSMIFEIKDGGGNLISNSLNIQVKNTPVINIAGGGIQNFCSGSTIGLTANGSGGNSLNYYYNWTPSSNINPTSSISSTLDYTISKNTNFTIYVSDGSCSSKQNVTVNAIGGYDFSKIPDRICSAFPFEINLADPNSTSTTYLWSNGSTNSTFSLPNLNAPNYSVTVTYNYAGGTCTVNKSFTCYEVGCCSTPPQAISIGGINYTNNNIDYLETALKASSLTNIIYNDMDNDGIDIINSSAIPHTILINNDFIVDKDLRLKKFNIKFTEGARIIVKPYRTLNLVDCQLSSCDNHLWDGIIVEEHGKIKTNSSTPAPPQAPNLYPTEIKEARNAIQLKDYTEYTIQNTTFKNNLIGMKFIGSSNYPNRSFGQISSVDFTSSTLSGTILPPYNGMTEVTSNRAFSGLDIENGMLVLSDPSTTVPNVKFSNLSCGINARNSVLSINSFKFLDFYLHPNVTSQWSGTGIFNEGYPYPLGSSSYTNINNTYLTSNSIAGFENINQGIYQNRGTLRAIRSIMTNVKQGVFVRDLLTDFIEINLNQINATGQGITSYRNDGASRININQNYINVNNPISFSSSSKFAGWGIAALERNLRHYSRSIDVRCNGISLNNALNGMFISSANNAILVENSVLLNNDVNQTGVYLTATTNSILSNNAVEGDGPSFTSNNSKGILLSMSPENDLYNNYTNNTRIGFDFWNANAQINMIGNRMGTHYTGLHINKSGSIGPQILSASNNSNGNRWYGYLNGGNYGSGFGAVNENIGIGFIDPDAPTFSQFFIDYSNTIGNLYYPYNDMPGFTTSNLNWFQTLINTPPIIPNIISYCLSKDQEKITHTYSIYDSLVVQDRTTASEFSEEVKYISARDLFDQLQKDSILLLANEFFRSYFDSIANYNISTLGQISNLLHDLYNTEGSMDSINNQLLNTLETKIERIKNINELFVTSNLSPTDSINLVIEGKYIIYEISKAKEQIGTLKKDLQLSINSKAFVALDLNNSLTPNNLIETNEKYINSFILQDIISPRIPNNNELSVLVSIATQCPFSGGRPVYIARNILYEYLPDITYNDMDLCTAEGLMRKNNDKTLTAKSSILISPNPATTFAKVIYLNDNDPIIEIQVLTLDGKLLLHQNNSLPLLVNSLSNGLYIVKCTTSMGEILTSKLTIVK